MKQQLLCLAALVLAGCASGPKKVDPSTAVTLTGRVAFTGKAPEARQITMDADEDCQKLHGGKGKVDDAVIVNPNGTLANVFVYVKSGLDGYKFEPPATPVTLNQGGCWFGPRVLGVQVGQPFQVTNSDPVTHNVHPVAQVNREWNYSQSQGDPPVERKFEKPEIMVPVKCNIHRWMRAWVGVTDNPYFAVTGGDGSFKIANLPPGEYTLAAWHEKFGTAEQKITVGKSAPSEITFTFKGE